MSKAPRRLRFAALGLLAGALLFSLASVSSGSPRVCDLGIVSPASGGSFPRMPVHFAQEGYKAEWFVAPSAFSMPAAVLVAPNGDLLVQCPPVNTLFRVTQNGTVTAFVEDVLGLAGDRDSQGNVYLYWVPTGKITRVSPSGTATVVVKSPTLAGECGGAFGIGPDGNMYVAPNQCSGVATLLLVTSDGQIRRVAERVPQPFALRTAPDGRFLLASYHDVYELSLTGYSLTLLAHIPGDVVSPGGLAADSDGSTYVSTGVNSVQGEVYRIDATGHVTRIAVVPDGGLRGIAWLPKTREVVGGQVRQGGLIAVGVNGAVREVVPGNGIVTPEWIAFSPCGELAVPCGEGAMMVLVDPAGRVSWFFDYMCYAPPAALVLFAPDGTLFINSEEAPAQPVRVAMMRPGGALEAFAALEMPCGAARRPNGSLVISECAAGRITELHPDGPRTILAQGLQYPESLALDAQGNLYAVTGGVLLPGGSWPLWGDTIVRITPEGRTTVVAHFDGCSGLAVAPSGDLFVAIEGGLAVITQDGFVREFASFFPSPRGIAFDLAGNLYVSDNSLNGIARIWGFPQGVLRGLVTDEAGMAVAGARVHVLSDLPIVVGQVVNTGPDGRFALPAAPRTYTLITTAAGYEETRLESIGVSASQEAVVRIVLKR